MDILGKVTGRTKVDPELSRKQRALKKRLMRKYPHLTSAQIDVSEVDFGLDEDAAKVYYGKQLGIAPEKVDLDRPYGSGLSRRASRRAEVRAAANNRQRGQRAFNRQEREGVRRREVAEAQHRLQSADTPMGANIRAAVAVFERVQEDVPLLAGRRAMRRREHESNLAAKQ